MDHYFVLYRMALRLSGSSGVVVLRLLIGNKGELCYNEYNIV